MTANTMTHDFGYSCEQQIRGLAGFAVRLGSALERWGRQAGEPLDRAELAHRLQVQREAREAILSRGDAHSGMYQLRG